MSGDVVRPSSPAGTVGSAILRGLVKLTFRVGAFGLGMTALLATLLYFKQDSMLYFPEISGLPRRPEQNPERHRSPEEYQVPYEDVYIECEDGVTIHAWLVLRRKRRDGGKDRDGGGGDDDGGREDPPTLIFFHGNAGNIGLRLPNAMSMRQQLDANVLMVEYRGYGNSDSAKPSEAGLKLDARAALRFAAEHPQIDASRLFLFGRSLGGAVALDLALHAERNGVPLAGVIVENTFLSISKMVDHLMPAIAPLKSLVLRIGWDSESAVPHLTVPVLYLAGRRDELVPHRHMLELLDKTSRSRFPKIHVVERGTHNETWLQGGRAYWDAIRRFLTEAAREGSGGGRSGGDDPTTGPPPSIADPSGDDDGSAIPIMPGGLMGIARESLRDGGDRPPPGRKKEL